MQCLRFLLLEKIIHLPMFKDLSFWINLPNLFIRRVIFLSSSGMSSSNFSLVSTFKAILFCFFSSVSCFSSLPSLILCSWNFPINVAEVVLDRLFFYDIVVTFSFHILIKDLIILRLSSSLVKVLPSAIKWFVKCVNLSASQELVLQATSQTFHTFEIMIGKIASILFLPM